MKTTTQPTNEDLLKAIFKLLSGFILFIGILSGSDLIERLMQLIFNVN